MDKGTIKLINGEVRYFAAMVYNPVKRRREFLTFVGNEEQWISDTDIIGHPTFIVR